jgi:hypothetical protein
MLVKKFWAKLIIAKPVDLVETTVQTIFLSFSLFNILYDYLSELCPQIAPKFVRDVGVKPSSIHNSKDFPGPGNESHVLMKKRRRSTKSSQLQLESKL